MSRQREWQKRQVAQGKCMLCGKKRPRNRKLYCELHTIRRREYIRSKKLTTR